jgi:hypothetical protein
MLYRQHDTGFALQQLVTSETSCGSSVVLHCHAQCWCAPVCQLFCHSCHTSAELLALSLLLPPTALLRVSVNSGSWASLGRSFATKLPLGLNSCCNVGSAAKCIGMYCRVAGMHAYCACNERHLSEF